MDLFCQTSAINMVEVRQDAPRMDITTFAVNLPPAIVQGFDEPIVDDSLGISLGDQGIVGTITFSKKAATIWFGWGSLQSSKTSGPGGNAGYGATPVGAKSLCVGTAPNLSMGPLVVAMPRPRYKGSLSISAEPSTSKLIGYDDEGDEMVARQMSSRLSQRLGIAIFVSCSFTGAPAMATDGVDQSIVQHRAAAFAEREVYRILNKKLNSV